MLKWWQSLENKSDFCILWLWFFKLLPNKKMATSKENFIVGLNKALELEYAAAV